MAEIEMQTPIAPSTQVKILVNDMEFPECEHLTGRKREICRGEAGIPATGPQSVESYRKAWGLPPLGERPTEPIVSQKPLSFFQKATSFVRTIGKTILSGTRSTQEIIDQRLAICQTCPQFENDGCKLCGCRINRTTTLRNKLANLSARCPANPPRWDAVE